MGNSNLYLDYEGLKYYHNKLQEQIDADHELIAQALETLDEKTEIQIGGETPSDEDIKLYIDENSDYAVVYTAALTESLINQAAAKIPTKVSQLTNDSNYTTSSEVDKRIKQVIGAAPEALDTLEEIADKLGDNEGVISGILETLGNKADKSDLDELELGEINVLSDWNQTDSTEDDYIRNKPTNVSAFTNDAGYLTQHLDISGKANASDVYTKTLIDNAGFLTQHLDISGKANTADLATVATSGSYNDLSDKPTIPTVPTNVSSFTNDAGYLTSHQDISGKANTADLAKVATSGDYKDLSNTPTLAKVATTGSYNDLSDKPVISDALIQSDWNQTDNTAKDFIKNKPTITDEVQIVANSESEIDSNAKIIIEDETESAVTVLSEDLTVDRIKSMVYTKAESDSKYLTEHLSLANYATKADVQTSINNLVNGAPEALDTLKELADKLSDEDDAVAALTNSVAEAKEVEIASTASSTNTKILIDEASDSSVEVYSKAQVDALIADIYQVLRNNGLTI